jgi:hypothetical protein
MDDEIFSSALPFFEAAQKFNPDNASLNWMIGFTHFQHNHLDDKCTPFLEKAFQLNPMIEKELTYNLGWSHHLHSRWDDAIKYYAIYKSKLDAGEQFYESKLEDVDKKIYECNNGKKYIQNPQRVFIDNMGGKINSSYPDYSAYISADESVLMFTSRRETSMGAERDNADHAYFEDIFTSTKINGEWTEAKNIGEPINSIDHDATAGLAPDGTTLYIYAHHGKGGGDIYRSKLNGKEWSAPEKMGKTINSEFRETTISEWYDGSKILFISNKKGGKGAGDIYIANRDEKGNYTTAINIGEPLNTKYSEEGVFLVPDGKTLYFSSRGHSSMGGYDVFRSKYDKETNTFGKPENMDFAISSPDDDVFYVVDSLNKDAVFASSRQSQEGFLHVYKVKVDRVPIQMAVVKGQFLSSIDTTIKKIDFTIRDYSNGDFIGKFNSNEKGGYLITFPKGGKYEFVMTVNDSPDEFRSIVTIPFMKEFKPLKQQIQHLNENGIVNVKIVNQFDQPVDEPATVLAEVVQKRGELNVNVQEFDMAKIEAQKASNSVLKDLGMEKLNIIEVSYTLQDQIKKGLDNKAGADKLNSNINNLIVENTSDFLRLEEQIKEKVAASGNATDANQKYKLQKEAHLLMEEQKELKDYSADLSRLRDSINQVMAGATSIRDIDKFRFFDDDDAW